MHIEKWLDPPQLPAFPKYPQQALAAAPAGAPDDPVAPPAPADSAVAASAARATSANRSAVNAGTVFLIDPSSPFRWHASTRGGAHRSPRFGYRSAPRRKRSRSLTASR